MGTILGSRHRHQLGGEEVCRVMAQPFNWSKMGKNSATYTFQSKKNLKVCMSGILKIP